MRLRIDISHLIIALLIVVGLAVPIFKAVDQTFDEFPLKVSCQNDFESLALAEVELLGPKKKLSQDPKLSSVQKKAITHFHWRFSEQDSQDISIKTQEHQTLNSKTQGHTTTISKIGNNGKTNQTVTYYTNDKNELLKYSTREGSDIREEWLCHSSYQAKAQANSRVTTVFPSI